MKWFKRLFAGKFVDCGDGTVADYLAGRMWQKIHAPERMTQQEAITYCESLTLAGHTDWRLPTIEEFRILFKNRDSKAEMSQTNEVCWTCSNMLMGPSNVALASDGTSFYKTEKFCVRAVRTI